MYLEIDMSYDPRDFNESAEYDATLIYLRTVKIELTPEQLEILNLKSENIIFVADGVKLSDCEDNIEYNHIYSAKFIEK